MSRSRIALTAVLFAGACHGAGAMGPAGAGAGGSALNLTSAANGMLGCAGAGGTAQKGAASSAGHGGAGGAGGNGGATPADPLCAAAVTVSFSHDVKPILNGCNGELCHTAPTHVSLVGKVADECCHGRLLVAPGRPSDSYLIDKLRGVKLCRGGAMPLDAPPLAPPQLAKITQWICGGALDD